MELKIGEKLTCKKNLYTFSQCTFTCGEEYEIFDIYNLKLRPTVICVSLESNSGHFVFVLYQVKCSLNLWDYFYNQQENRKLKISQIEKYSKKNR